MINFNEFEVKGERTETFDTEKPSEKDKQTLVPESARGLGPPLV